MPHLSEAAVRGSDFTSLAGAEVLPLCQEQRCSFSGWSRGASSLVGKEVPDLWQGQRCHLSGSVRGATSLTGTDFAHLS